MKEAVRQTRSHLMSVFERHGFHPRTDLGQNFLIDLNLVEYIAEEARLQPNDVVLEIGAGTGGLTTYLADYAAEVVSVEVDSNMAGIAKSVLADRENVTLLNTDALKNKNNISTEVLDTIAEKLSADKSRRLKLVANLPYNIATPVISNLVASDLEWDRMVVTIQWELALKMVAEPRTSDYSALSVWLQSQCFVKIKKKLPPNVFWPRPKVNSAIVRLVPDHTGRKQIADRPFFQDFVRRLFHQRRKLARGVLCGMYRKQISKPQMDEILSELGHDPNTRAEELDVSQLVELGNRIHAEVATAS